MLLDLVRLEERRLERAWCDEERDRACLRQHLERSFVHAVLLTEVTVDAMMKRRRLAHIEDAAIGPKHAIDAGRIRQREAQLARHRPDAPPRAGRRGGCGEPVVERAPGGHALRLENA